MNILYLEDSSDVRADITNYLRRGNHQVVDFYAIDDAREYLEDGDPKKVDCIITDLNMDDEFLDDEFLKCYYRTEAKGNVLSGWVWLRRFVWTNPAYSNVPCVFYSGYIDYFEEYLENDQEARDCLNAHRVHFIRKGEGYGKLQEALKRI